MNASSIPKYLGGLLALGLVALGIRHWDKANHTPEDIPPLPSHTTVQEQEVTTEDSASPFTEDMPDLDGLTDTDDTGDDVSLPNSEVSSEPLSQTDHEVVDGEVAVDTVTFGTLAMLCRSLLSLDHYHYVTEGDSAWDEETRCFYMMNLYTQGALDAVTPWDTVTREDALQLIAYTMDLHSIWDLSHDAALQEQVALGLVLYDDHDDISPHCITGVYGMRQMGFDLTPLSTLSPSRPVTLEEVTTLLATCFHFLDNHTGNYGDFSLAPTVEDFPYGEPALFDLQWFTSFAQALHALVSSYSGLLDGEVIYWNREHGGVLITTASGHPSDLSQLIQWKLGHMLPFPPQSEFFKEQDIAFHVASLATPHEGTAFLYIPNTFFADGLQLPHDAMMNYGADSTAWNVYFDSFLPSS